MIQPADYRAFPVEERIDLVDALWESLDPELAARIKMISPALDVFLQQALRLSIDERIELAQDI